MSTLTGWMDDSIDRLAALHPNAARSTLEELFSQCADEFMLECNRDDVPERAATVIEQMTAFRLSQLNAEGVSSFSGGGASEGYRDDWPQRIRRAMHRYRRVRLA